MKEINCYSCQQDFLFTIGGNEGLELFFLLTEKKNEEYELVFLPTHERNGVTGEKNYSFWSQEEELKHIIGSSCQQHRGLSDINCFSANSRTE